MLTIKRLSLEDARVLIAGARAKAEEIGVPMCITVCDESGQLISFERMDGEKRLCQSGLFLLTCRVSSHFCASLVNLFTRFGLKPEPLDPTFNIRNTGLAAPENRRSSLPHESS